MTINFVKLDRELREAGIPINGVDEDGVISYLPSVTVQQIAAAEVIKAAHDPSTPIGTWIVGHITNRRTFMRALKALDDGINAHATPGANQLTDYRAALIACMSIVNDLPNAFINNLNKERDMAGLGAVDGLSLAQCFQFAVWLRTWLTQRVAIAAMLGVALD